MLSSSIRLQALVRFDALQALLRAEQMQANSHSVLAQALTGLDERGFNLFLLDAVLSTDDIAGAWGLLLADASSVDDAVLPLQWGVLLDDTSATAEARSVDWYGSFAEGAPADYFAGDYALDPTYNAVDNFSSDAFTGGLQNYAIDPSYFAGDYATTLFV